MEEKAQKPYGRLKVMVAVSDSPESKAALGWAMENLVCKEDWLLIYHTVKTPDLIPNAMGKVPFIGAAPEMQKAHLMVATEDANKLLASLEAYCTSMKIFPFTEVGRCENRKEDIIEKVREEGITHLVMGTKKKSRFAFKSWGPRRSLTSRICQEVACHVTLVDKDKRSTFHTKVPTFKTGDAQMQHRSLSLSKEALEILKESGLRSLSSEPAVKEPAITPKPEAQKKNTRPNNRYATPPPTRQSFSTFTPPPAASNLFTPPKPPRSHSLSAIIQEPKSPVSGPARLQSDGLSRQNSDADDIKRVLKGEILPSKDTQNVSFSDRFAPRNRSAARLKSARHFYSSPARCRNDSVFMSEGSEDESECRDYSFSAKNRMLGAHEQSLLSKRPATVAPAQPITARQLSSGRGTAVTVTESPTYAPVSPEVTLKAVSSASVKKRFFSSPSRSGKVTQSDFLASPTRDASPSKSAKRSLRYSSPSKWLASLALAHIKPPANAESDVARLRKSQEAMRKSQDDVISQLWQQVEKLKEIGVLRDQEIVEVANRAQRAEREAEERDRALAEQARELAELKANQLVMQMAALSASPDHYDCDDTNGPKDWPSFAGTGLWTISEG